MIKQCISNVGVHVKLWKMEYRMHSEIAEQKRIEYRIWNKWQSCETQERIEYRVYRNRKEQMQNVVQNGIDCIHVMS